MRRSTPIALLAATAAAVLAFATPAQAGGRPFEATLLGANETPSPTDPAGSGDPNGSGTANITVNTGTGTVCYEITVANLDPVILGHIHEAPAGSAGPVRVDFSLTQSDFVDGTASGCVLDVDRALAKEIAKDSDSYYVNIHTTAFPAGALRGQL